MSLSSRLFPFQFFSYICIYVPCFLCALCSVSSFHSMHHASYVRFSSCTQHASTCIKHTQQPLHLFSLLRIYILYAPTASYALCLCMIFTTSLFFFTGRSLCLLLMIAWLTSREKYLHFYVLHLFPTSSHLLDNHTNSSSSLAIILSFFFIIGCYPKILWLLWYL